MWCTEFLWIVVAKAIERDQNYIVFFLLFRRVGCSGDFDDFVAFWALGRFGLNAPNREGEQSGKDNSFQNG